MYVNPPCVFPPCLIFLLTDSMEKPSLDSPLITTSGGSVDERNGITEFNWRREALAEVRKQLYLAGPLIASSLLQIILQVISVMFVGHLGELSLAGASMATSFAGVTRFSVMLGMGSALETFCGQSFGAKKYRMLGIHLQSAMLVLMTVCIPVAFVWAYTGKILMAFGQDPEISVEAGLYARWLIPSFFAYGLLQCYVRFLQTQNIVLPMMLASAVTTLLHVFVCWFLVFKSGLGNKGAALANSISYWTNVVLLWWVTEYLIDGFNFHSLSSMMYTHNGFATFSGEMEEYCNQYVDKDALIYLILANEMLHEVHPKIITIAEDATFYPGLCEPTSQGGLGFDYWVNVSVSDMWLGLLIDVPQLEWSMNKIVDVLVRNSQRSDKMLLYVENHNQSISGGGSFADILLRKQADKSFKRDDMLLRGSSLLQMMKLITFTVSGSAYLNFMGNEFGHLNRVEFPLPSNNYSFSCANRQWDLLRNKGLHCDQFNFDKDMMRLDEIELLLSKGLPNIHHVNDSMKVISYIRGPLLFIFNFHPEMSYELYNVGVEEAGEYQIILNTDEAKYGGLGVLRRDHYLLRTISKRNDGYRNTLEVTLPSRSAQVYKLIRILRV